MESFLKPINLIDGYFEFEKICSLFLFPPNPYCLHFDEDNKLLGLCVCVCLQEGVCFSLLRVRFKMVDVSSSF